jgi:hypothetical protein
MHCKIFIPRMELVNFTDFARYKEAAYLLSCSVEAKRVGITENKQLVMEQISAGVGNVQYH